MKLNQDDFLAECFRDKERVSVNANELQKFIRDAKKESTELAKARNRISILMAKVEVVQEQIEVKLYA